MTICDNPTVNSTYCLLESKGGLVAINRASPLCDPGLTLASRSHVGWI